MTAKTKVIVGLSGGVDSAAAAYLLKEAGYEVIGTILRTSRSVNRCCEIDAARRIAWQLGIAFHPLDATEIFAEEVEKPFAAAYRDGLTPNPCTVCNPKVKWARLLYQAKVLGADLVATGHYAKITTLPGGRYAVQTAKDPGKDQSYMLYGLSQEALAKTLFPLGDYTKGEVRALARRVGLEAADKPDSQEICFIPAGDYGAYLRENWGENTPGPGNFVDEAGKVLGTHQGIFNYTVGQRKGLGLALGYPVYVTAINKGANEVVVGPAKSAAKNKIICHKLNFMAWADLPLGCQTTAVVKIRYRHPGTAAIIKRSGEDEITAEFSRPVSSPAPGQAAVFYDDSGLVLGGGIIAGSSMK